MNHGEPLAEGTPEWIVHKTISDTILPSATRLRALVFAARTMDSVNGEDDVNELLDVMYGYASDLVLHAENAYRASGLLMRPTTATVAQAKSKRGAKVRS